MKSLITIATLALGPTPEGSRGACIQAPCARSAPRLAASAPRFARRGAATLSVSLGT